MHTQAMIPSGTENDTNGALALARAALQQSNAQGNLVPNHLVGHEELAVPGA